MGRWGEKAEPPCHSFFELPVISTLHPEICENVIVLFLGLLMWIDAMLMSVWLVDGSLSV